MQIGKRNEEGKRKEKKGTAPSLDGDMHVPLTAFEMDLFDNDELLSYYFIKKR